ncbi:MAG TPA: PDZ domain-containing protein, partial [Acidimicrobiales bacterium]|nr:PDZ domain-containing protein [Acidimicrobiales bacterium]
LVASGEVDHGWLGASGPTDASAPPSPSPSVTDASIPAATHADGAVLASVASDSPAALAGLAAGDVVMAVDGAPVHSMTELMTRLYPDPPGTPVAITFERASTTQTVEVQLADDSDSVAEGSP